MIRFYVIHDVYNNKAVVHEEGCPHHTRHNSAAKTMKEAGPFGTMSEIRIFQFQEKIKQIRNCKGCMPEKHWQLIDDGENIGAFEDREVNSITEYWKKKKRLFAKPEEFKIGVTRKEIE